MKKKSSSRSKQPLKLTQVQAHAEHQRRHRITLGIGIVIIAVLLALVICLMIVPKVNSGIRLQRINDVFSKIEMPTLIYDEYDDIFGEKKPYDGDDNGSFASYKQFVVGKTVTDAFSDFDQEIKNAGFTEISDTSGKTKIRNYRNENYEYISLTVESKPRLDAFQNQLWMKSGTSNFNDIDPDMGPARVTIAVNLDDNTR